MPAGSERRSLPLNRIYGYECKRLVFNKYFIGINALILIYGWQVLKNITIAGVSFTAPFSAWSFGDYVSRMTMFLWIGTLFFQSVYYSKEEKRRAGIFETTPMKPYIHERIRCGAVLTVSLALVIVSVLPAGIFYGRVFRCYPLGMIAGVSLITLLPILVFAVGSGRMLAHAGRPFLYLWMIVPFVLRVCPLPEAFGLLNGSLFADRPLQLGGLDPEFSLSTGAVIVQCLLFLLGMFLILFRVRSRKNRQSLPVTLYHM